MIAKQVSHFDDEVLQQLLDESLDAASTARVQTHLTDCDRCQQSLHRLAGESSWWDETREVLGQHPTPIANAESKSPLNIEPLNIDWLMPILTPDADGLGRLDRYPVTAVVGQGGMGVVLRGFDGELNRPVALKVLSPHLANVGAAKARFMREAQAAAAIVHPSIVPIYSVVTSARLPYLVMPLVEGGNLQQRIDATGPMDLIELLRIGVEVAEGLAAAHDRGLIHRDIKPANVLIEAGNGRTLITDFGLARALDDASITCSGMIAGTPQYMSPEQARGEPLDGRSDLFSLGSLLYCLATGRPPFRADNPLAVLKKITETSPRPVHQINERMPVWLDRLLGRLMAIDASERIENATAAATLLRQAHAHVQNPSMHPLPTTLLPPKTSKRWLVVAGVSLVTLLGIIAWQLAPAEPTQTNDLPRQTATMPTEPLSTSSTDWVDVEFENELQWLNADVKRHENELNISPVLKGQPR